MPIIGFKKFIQPNNIEGAAIEEVVRLDVYYSFISKINLIQQNLQMQFNTYFSKKQLIFRH